MSWVVRNKDTKIGVVETFSKKNKSLYEKHLNHEKYEIVPVLQYLQELNRINKGAEKPL